MASQLSVELDGVFPTKRFNIKTTPAMSLNDVLRAAQEKAGSSPNARYVLKHGKNILDLSLSVRLANLPSGAKLTLSPATATANTTPSAPQLKSQPVAKNDPAMPPAAQQSPARKQVVTIALQIEDGPRVIQKFNILETLWDVLKTIEQENSLNLTKRESVPPITPPSSNLPKALKSMSETAKNLAAQQAPLIYSFPLLILANKEFSTFSALKGTTLESCGLRGGSNALIRLLWRLDPDIRLINVLSEVDGPWERMADIPNSQQITSPPAANVHHVADKNLLPSVTPPVPQASTDDKSNLDATTEKADPVTEGKREGFDRSVRVFAPPPETMDSSFASKIQLPDSFFELTATELKHAHASARSANKAAQDAPLMTKAMRDRQDAERAAKWPKTMIRVRFPDRTCLEAAFLSSENVDALFALVDDSVRDQRRKYMLYISPPLQDLVSKRGISFWKAGLAPASMVYFKWIDGEVTGSFLSDDCLSKIQEFPVPPANEFIQDWLATASEPSQSAASEMNVEESVDEQGDSRMGDSQATGSNYKYDDNPVEKKVPKWFKIGKK
ncbi:Tether containing UBX domain for GLUT4 [Entophlyctis luteolus]|nr:Tether containing UBX domain for GLUT4 [Entophlyctis luteolus]